MVDQLQKKKCLGKKSVQSLCLRKKNPEGKSGLTKNSRIENFSHPLPPVISNDPSLTWGDTKHFLKNAYYLHLFVLHWCVTFRLQVPCMLAAQILKPQGILYVWLLSHSSVVVLLISNIQYKKIQTYNHSTSDRLENTLGGSCSILLLCRYPNKFVFELFQLRISWH